MDKSLVGHTWFCLSEERMVTLLVQSSRLSDCAVSEVNASILPEIVDHHFGLYDQG
jgi:hypothetical protein